MEKETLAPHPHYQRKVSFPFHTEHSIHAGLYHHGARRPSVAYRAVKAVENVARRMSTPDFSIDRIEQDLEEELQRESKQPEKLVDILRRSGEKLLHSKKVLFLIVLLNIIDCGLVLGELILDIHFIKDMVFDSKQLIKKFTFVLRTLFPSIFGIIDTLNVKSYFNTVIETISQHPTKTNFTLLHNDSGEIFVFTQDDMPTYLDPTVITIEEDISHAFHKASIAILGFLVLLTILKVFCYGKEIFKKKLQLFDGVIVLISFILDLAFIKGMMEYPLEEAVQILAFLIPWRVIRVANSLVVSVTDQAHLQLKIIYSQKKATENRLQFSQQQIQYHRDVLNRVKKMCEEAGIDEWKISAVIKEIPVPRKRKSKKFGLSIKKKLDKSINCIRLNDPRVSLPYGDPNMTESPDYDSPETENQEFKHKMFKVPSIHVIEPSDTIYESEEDEFEEDADEDDNSTCDDEYGECK